jgi:hypothetical protein
VIESEEFYQLFPALKRVLDKQKLTHNTAGEFLHTVKTLMAKLKVRLNRRTFLGETHEIVCKQMIGALCHVRILTITIGSIDERRIAESMASHRAQLLLARLPNALAFGLQEVHPDSEPLKV